MGKQPTLDTTERDRDGFLSIGEKEMLQALESLLTAVEDASVTKEDYHFKFITADFNKQSGSCNRSARRRRSYEPELSEEMVIAVKSAFEDVNNGCLKEGGYYFELTTPHFHFTSGLFPLLDRDGGKCWDAAREHVLACSLWKTAFWGNLMYMIHLALVLEALSRLTLQMHVRASHVATEEQPLTLELGTNGIIPFGCRNEHQTAPKYYTVKFEGKDRPFCLDGALDPEGLMSPDQFERFSVVYVENDNEMSIEINIASVSVEDQGTYVVMVIIQGEATDYRLMKKVVLIFIPPGPAVCFLMPSEIMKAVYEIHCSSKPGNGSSTLACFQNDEKITYRHRKDTDSSLQIVHRRIFWLMNLEDPVSCCAHDVKEIDSITQESCNQYRYPSIETVNRAVSPSIKAPTKRAHTSRLLAIEEENKPFLEPTSYSGSGRNFAWPTFVLSIMAFITYGCMSNP